MKERIALNPMQQSYLRGREAKCGMFSKACFVYEYDPAKVAHDRLVEALQRLPQLHPLLGAGLDGETLVLGAGRLDIQEVPCGRMASKPRRRHCSSSSLGASSA